MPGTTGLGFNPVLGFLSVSTLRDLECTETNERFQSRAGFSECLDPFFDHEAYIEWCFNPVLGFLSVSTS